MIVSGPSFRSYPPKAPGLAVQEGRAVENVSAHVGDQQVQLAAAG